MFCSDDAPHPHSGDGALCRAWSRRRQTAATSEETKMTNRNPILVFVLAVCTCGIYGLVWYVKTKEEMNQQEAGIPTAWLLIPSRLSISTGSGSGPAGWRRSAVLARRGRLCCSCSPGRSAWPWFRASSTDGGRRRPGSRSLTRADQAPIERQISVLPSVGRRYARDRGTDRGLGSRLDVSSPLVSKAEPSLPAGLILSKTVAGPLDNPLNQSFIGMRRAVVVVSGLVVVVGSKPRS